MDKAKVLKKVLKFQHENVIFSGPVGTNLQKPIGSLTQMLRKAIYGYE